MCALVFLPLAHLCLNAACHIHVRCISEKREKEKPSSRRLCAARVEAKVQFKAHHLQIRDGYGFYFSSFFPPPE